MRDIGDAKAGLETQALVEGMHAHIGPTALHQDVVTTRGPGVRQCSPHDGGPVTATAQVGMRHDILEKAMPPSLAQQIGRGYQHAAGTDTRTVIGDKDMQPGLRQRFPPDLLGAFARLCGRADLGHREQREQ